MTNSIVEEFLRDDATGALVTGTAAPYTIQDGFLRDANYALVIGATATGAQVGFQRDANYALVTVDYASATPPLAVSRGFLRDANDAIITVSTTAAAPPTNMRDGFLRDANYALVVLSTTSQLTLTPVASDNFDRANGTIAGANNWLATSEGSAAITSNQIAGVASTAAGDYRTDVYSSNQYAQCAVGSVALASGAYIGVSVRNQDNANNYTGIYFNNTGVYQLQVYKRVAGTFTLLLSNTIAGPLAQGTVLQLVAEGSQITFNPPAQPAVGGVSIADATFTGGTPGIEVLGTGSLDSWVGGNAATAAHAAATVSDAFTRANGGVSAGQANWAVMAYSPAVGATVDATIVTNQISYATVTVHGGDVRTDAFNSDHWAGIAEGTVAMTASGFTGVTTRNQNVGRSCYLFTFFNNVAYQIYRLDGTGAAGTDSSHLIAGVATSGNDPAGTLYEGLSQGTRHSMRVNGKEVLSVTDATYAGGTAGLMMFATASADNWSGGNL